VQDIDLLAVSRVGFASAEEKVPLGPVFPNGLYAPTACPARHFVHDWLVREEV